MAESPTMEVRARLSADSAQFVQGMERATRSTEQFQGAAQKVSASSIALGAAIGTAAASLIAFGVKSFRAAAEVERLDFALQAVGASSGLGYEALKEASDGMRRMGIQASVAQRMTLKLAQSNIEMKKATDIAKVAQDLSVASNISAEEALERVTLAITTGQSRMLRSVGITDASNSAMERYAATLGKKASALTMAERRQAVMNQVMREGGKVAGAYAIALQSPAKLLTLFGDLHKDLQVNMGGALIKGFGPLIKAAFRFEKALVDATSEGGKLRPVIDALELVLTKLTKPVTEFIEKAADFIENMTDMGTGSEKLAGKMSMLLPVFAGVGTGFAALAGKDLLKGVPIFGQLITKINPFVAGLTAIALTSPQVQSAFRNLLSALSPLLPVVTKIGLVFSTVLAYAIGIVAKAIEGIAKVVRVVVGFFQKYEVAAKALGIALGALVIAIIATKVPTAIATAQNWLLQKSQLAVSKASGIMASSLFLPVLAIVAVIGAIVLLYQQSETFREGFTNVFNTVAKYVGEALAWIISGIGNLLIAFGTAIAPTTSFGQTLISVVQFIYTAWLTAIQGVLKVVVMFLKGLNYLMSSNTALGKVVRAVLNFIFKAYVTVVGGILKFIGFFLEVLGMLLDTHGFVGKVIGMILDFLWKSFATVIGGIIKYIGMFIEFLGNLLDTNSMVGKLIAGVLDFLIDAFATVFGGIFKFIAKFVGFLGDLLDTNQGVGKYIAKVWEFIADTVLYVVEKIAGFLAKGVGALVEFVKGNKEGLQTGIDIFNKFAEGVGNAVAFIPKILGQALVKFGSFLKSIADKTSEYLTKIADGVRQIPVVGPALAAPIDAAASTIGKFGATVEKAFDAVGKPLINFAAKVENATKNVISDTALNTFIKKATTIQTTLQDVSKNAGSIRKQEFAADLVQGISDALKKVSGMSDKIGNTILEVTKVPIAEGLVQAISDALTNIGGFTKKIGETVIEAGDIKLGTELVQMLSDASKFIGGAVKKVGDFVYEMKQLEVGDILGDIVENVTDFAIPQIEKLIGTIEGLKDLPVGKFLIENLSEKSIQAGEKLLTFAAAVKSFTSENTLQKLTDGFGNLADKLKESLGFGDILKKEQEKIDQLTKAGKTDDGAADSIQNQADLMAKIRDAMRNGIESMRDVLTDLQDAAKQFADSLKDTILGFAGLKGVELPDGFIPKAKSLIENMRMRLDKSQQFANQIMTLQGLGLNAKSIQDLVEEGPLKGAQLAASILGGGADAIKQINELQKQISFTGTAIGAMGSEAAFGERLANAYMNMAAVEGATLGVRGLGTNNIVIEQGAFVVNVDTAGLTTDEEKVDLITRRIQETFAILAKELANK